VASKNGPDTPADPELPPSAPLNIWLAPLVKLAWSLGRQSSGRVSLDNLVVANVEEQVEELRKSPTIGENKDVQVHGWVYILDKGRLMPTRPLTRSLPLGPAEESLGAPEDGEGQAFETSDEPPTDFPV
jgi:hypothetical protein